MNKNDNNNNTHLEHMGGDWAPYWAGTATIFGVRGRGPLPEIAEAMGPLPEGATLPEVTGDDVIRTPTQPEAEETNPAPGTPETPLTPGGATPVAPPAQGRN